MFERGATLRVAPGPLAGVGAQLLLLATLAQTVGIGRAGWVVGAATGAILDATLAGALWRNATARLGPAGWITLTRATFAVGAAAVVAASFARPVPATALVALAIAALVLDFVDGRVARRTGTVSPLGAWLDGEVDAFLILALSVYVARSAGVWVLAIGLARYAFLAAVWLAPWMRAPLPRRDWRKVPAAAQGIALTVAAADVVPRTPMRIVLAAALALLAESFGRDVWWLWRHRRDATAQAAARRAARPAAALLLSLGAVAVVWAALALPDRPALLTPAGFARLPLEGIAAIALAVLLPARARRVLPWALGPLLGLLVLVKALDIGFFVAFDRPFNPVDDWSFGPIGIETVRDTFGSTDADLVAAAAVVLAASALVLPTLSLVRVTRLAGRHRRASLWALAGLAAVWAACATTSVASTSGARLAVDEVRAFRSDLQDHARFTAQLRHDDLAGVGASRLLTALRGKDVLLVFVESYGRLAVEGSPFSPRIDSILDAGTRGLAESGFSARSGWLTSSTFGGGSWWAHATLQSGTWIDTQGRYEELVKSDRLTLTRAFGDAGWRTVADVPSDTRSWPEGTSFYRYDAIYDRRSLGYRGPKYAFAAMPDQYVLLALQRLELAKPQRPPIFSEIDLVSSHTPWTRIPPLIPWGRVGDGSIFKRLPVDQVGIGDPSQGYAESIAYTLRALVSFVERYGDENTVLIVLGDHQPSRVVSGSPGHDVPISIVAHDPAVLQRIAGWGWTDGLRPGDAAPVWQMSAFRNRFLAAFGS